MSTVELSWQVSRDTAVHRLRFGQVHGAIDHFAEALQATPSDGEARERVRVEKARAELAASGPARALETLAKPQNYPGTLVQCRALYDAGELECHLVAASNGHRSQRPTGGHRHRDFGTELDLGRSTFDHTLGERAGRASLLEYRHRFPAVAAEQRALREASDGRPRWQVLAEAGECDAISVQELVQREPPIRERARRAKNTQILGQLHLGRGWETWSFVREMRPEGRYGSIVNLPQTKDSSRAMAALVEDCYAKISAQVKQSQACYPLYSQRYGRFGPAAKNRRQWHEIDQLLKYRYRAYRAVYQQFDRMHELRDRGQSVQLFRFVGEVLRDFYKITPGRVLPEKGKLVREVCNLAGLAVVDGLRIPPTLMDEAPDERLSLLFAVPPAKEPIVVVPVFGDASTYRDPTAPDRGFLRYKAKLAELESCHQRAEYSIERCFLGHEMARLHLRNGWLDDVKVMGSRIADEAIACGSHLWWLVGQLTYARALCAQHQLEQLEPVLLAIGQHVHRSLPDERVAFFVELAQKLTRDSLARKRNRTGSVELTGDLLQGDDA
ncbi:uncharacterized protein LOC128270112 [Anopheles cruzii]|uniref:uncharacterized protein LOC128270112 n=1 Tax=Anopheles cruzii TaxID=68878 RepID=UPI0022EC517E|nr:uncharacterized protein LOC128270112 [Anopheles cruzii]